MSFRFQKRVKLGGGFGLNISKSGISPSLRTKMGTFSKTDILLKQVFRECDIKIANAWSYLHLQES